MATALAPSAPSLVSLNPSTKFTPLSSSSSVFFSSNKISNNWSGLGLSVRPKRRGLSCNCLFGLGVPELVVIAGVTALVFGPKKLPEVGRSIGKTVKSFQQAAKEFESELKKDAAEASSAEDPSAEKITAVSAEEKQEAQVSSTKETS